MLCRPRIVHAHRRTEAEIDALLKELYEHAAHVDPPSDAPVEGPDPGDAHLWRLLATAPAVLITGDYALRTQKPTWARVMSPREWIDSIR